MAQSVRPSVSGKPRKTRGLQQGEGELVSTSIRGRARLPGPVEGSRLSLTCERSVANLSEVEATGGAEMRGETVEQAAGRERQHREALVRAVGMEVFAALGNPDVTEIYVNPGGRLFVDTRSGGRVDAGVVLEAEAVQRFPQSGGQRGTHGDERGAARSVGGDAAGGVPGGAAAGVRAAADERALLASTCESLRRSCMDWTST